MKVPVKIQGVTLGDTHKTPGSMTADSMSLVGGKVCRFGNF